MFPWISILALQQQLRRMGGDHEHHHMTIKPSRFQWDKFKDLMHFYVMIGVLPITALVLYANIFVGPSQLAEIPEGYEPKHWEYEKVLLKWSLLYLLILNMCFAFLESNFPVYCSVYSNLAATGIRESAAQHLWGERKGANSVRL